VTSARTCLAIVLTLLLAAPLSARHKPVQHPKFDLKRPEIVAFVNDVVARNQLKKRQVLALLRKGEPQPKIIEAMTRPAEKVTPWWEYHDHFLTEERISLGAQFYASIASRSSESRVRAGSPRSISSRSWASRRSMDA